MALPVYQCVIDPALNSDLEVQAIALVDYPAIERNFQVFSATQHTFAADKKRQIITGPAMMADMRIYRNDSMGEYYSVFSAETIEQIAIKFFQKGLMSSFNIMHDGGQKCSDVTLFESYLVNRALGKNPPTGYEDAKDGSWFISSKVGNDTWPKVESGEMKGFSIEGFFDQVKVNMSAAALNEEQFIQQFTELLKRYKK